MVNIVSSIHQRATAGFARLFARAGDTSLRRFVAADKLSPAERAELGPQLYAIFCASYGELSSEVVLDEIVFKAGGYLGLYHDPSGQLVGFSALKVDTVEARGRRCRAIAGSAYFRPGFKGGRAAGRLGLVFGLAQRLRYPFDRMVYALEMLSPVSYRRGARIFAQIYPHRELATPAWARAAADAVIEQRGLLGVPGRPWIVRYDDPASHARTVPAPLTDADPEVQFYLAQNPGYREGDILFSIVPLTGLNLLASLSPRLTAALRSVGSRAGQPRAALRS